MTGTSMATLATAAHSTGRHRGDGGRPSGNSNTTTVGMSGTPSIQTQRPTHSVSRAPGRSASACCVANTDVAVASPIPTNSQPIGCPRRRERISAPITG
jgi:hypothetical protein